jgi:hypothetical protein
MKKLILLFVICFLSSCTPDSPASPGETGITTTAENQTTTKLMTETTGKNATTTSQATELAITTAYPIPATILPDDLTRTYPSSVRTEDEQALADVMYAGMSESRITEKVLEYIQKCGRDDGYREVYHTEYFGDFGSGFGMFLYSSVQLTANTPDWFYRELWYTDGETVTFVNESEGRSDFSGMINPENGAQIVFAVDNVVMGAPVQYSHVYNVRGGKPEEYFLPDKESFFGYPGGGRNVLFIRPYDVGEDFDDYIWHNDEPDDFQTLGWVDGEIVVIDGFGA